MLEIGVCFYPEQWPRGRWDTDVRLMKEAGITVARLGEHVWGLLEPEPGNIETGWLRECLDLLYEHGIKALLCTPTACPPQWMYTMYPDLPPVGLDGRTFYPGSRHAYCPTHTGYKDRSLAIVRAMVEQLGEHPTVVGWQLDNEIGTADTLYCTCTRCTAAFRAWAQQQYGTLAEVNRAWGGVFWSQRYTAWDQIHPPRRTPHPASPGLVFSYYRFASEMAVEFLAAQVREIRKVTPGTRVTHNMMAFFDRVNYDDLATCLDVAGLDVYVRRDKEPDFQRAAMAHDFARGLKRQPHWVLESQAMSALSGHAPSRTSRPGEVRLWTYQAIARGAAKVFYFNWRTCPYGGETFWQGILGHSGQVNRFYWEVAQTGKEFQTLNASAMDQVAPAAAQVALLYCHESCMALRSQTHLHPHLPPQQVLQSFHKPLYRLNVPVDIVGPGTDFSHYRVVVAPMLYMVDEALAGRLRRFVERGGSLLIGFRSGVVTPHNRAWELPLPGLLAGLCGITVPEYDPVPSGCPVALTGTALWQGATGTCTGWCDVVEPKEAETFMQYASEYYAGRSAITYRRLGGGCVWYTGTLPDAGIMTHLISNLLAGARVPEGPPTPEGVEAAYWTTGGVPWDGSERSALVSYLNHTPSRQTVDLPPGRWEDIPAGVQCSGQIETPPTGVCIVRSLV